MSGSTANRVHQYFEVPTDELRGRLDDALARLHSMDAVKRSVTAERMNLSALATLRKQTFDLVNGLRAELRRRLV